MKLFNYLLLFAAVFTLTACPLLNPPEPIAPLATPKTQKTSFKLGCRVKIAYSDASNVYTYTYDAEGKLIRQRNLRNDFGYDYAYDANGFMVRRDVFYGEGLLFPDQKYEYDAGGSLKASQGLFPNSQREFDAAGRITKETVRDPDNTVSTITYKYNAAGYLIEEERVGKFCDGEKTCTVLFRYDDNGNPTFLEARSTGFGVRLTEWTYDKNPNPENLLPTFKGWPAKRPLNNVTRQVSKSTGFTHNGFTFPAQESTSTYEYTYNAQGYPVQVKNVYTSLSTIDNRTTTYANEYENCPVP